MARVVKFLGCNQIVSMSFVLAFGITLLLPQTGLAYNSEDYDYFGEEEPTELGEAYEFESTPSYTASNEIGIECIACVGGATYTVKVNSGPTKITQKFVRYLTGDWSYSDRYTWSKTNSASSTVSVDLGTSAANISSKLGVSASTTTSYSTTVSIPANKSKLSKLAFYSDYNRRNVTVTSRIGTTSSSKTGNHFAPRKDTYLLVAYK